MTKENQIRIEEEVRQVSAALQRASLRAREVARQTNTAIIVMRDGKLVRELPPAVR